MKTPNTRKPLNHHGTESHDKQPFFSKIPDGQHSRDSGFFQAKLAVGSKDDKFEKEADTVADQVQQKTEADQEKPALQAKEDDRPTQTIEGMGLEKEEAQVQQKQTDDEEKPVQQKTDDAKDDEKPVQQKASGAGVMEAPVSRTEAPGITAGGEPGLSIAEKIRTSKGQGVCLPDDVLHSMQATFKVDLSQVRIHTGQDAIAMNQELASLAFTNGYDIYFGAGQYQPHTAAGRHLLAHELTHVVQQKAPPTIIPGKK